MKKILILLGIIAASGGFASSYIEIENLLTELMNAAELFSKNIQKYIP